MKSKNSQILTAALLLLSFVCALPPAGRAQFSPTADAPQFAAHAPKALTYSIIELGTLGGNSSFARDINDRAQITGNASLPSGRLHAFLWERGVMRDLGILTPGVDFSRGFALNEAGVVTGESDNNSPKTFVYDPAVGAMINLAALVGNNPDNLNIAGGFGAGINDAGQIVGTTSRGAPSVIRGYFFSNGTARDLGSIDGLTTTPARAWGINDFGQSVGVSRNSNNVSHATFWATPGAATDLGSLGGATAFSEAFRINNRGQIVGRSTVAAGQTPQNAVMWENGQIRDLGRLPGVNFGRANDINDFGTIVGTSSQFEGFSGRAVIWRAGETAPTDLNTLLPANSGWTLLTSAEGINNHGQIVGFGTRNGQTRAFLMTPYDVCLTDAERGVTVLINSQSGDYQIIDCRQNRTLTGRGEVCVRGCLLTLREPRDGFNVIDVAFNLCRLTGTATYFGFSRSFFTNTVTDNEQGNAPGCGGACGGN
jgi:probable HAF family extracellular repeat protein